MPIFRTCDTNVEQAQARFEQTNDERMLILGWLCNYDYRVQSNGDRSTFLDDVHDSYHDRGYLSDAQWVGVSRWYNRAMRRRVSAPAPVADENEVESYDPVSDEETDAMASVLGVNIVAVDPRVEAYTGPHDVTLRWGDYISRSATWQEAEWVYNGEYMVYGHGGTVSLRITTIASSRTNAGLVGKRAVSVYQGERWVPFAFVTRSGHLVLWSRFVDQGDEFYVHCARALLEGMREQDRGSDAVRWSMRYEGYAYRVTREVLHCRSCNRDMELDSGDDRNDGVHDADCTAERVVGTRVADAVRRPGPRNDTFERPRRTSHAAGFVSAPEVRPPALSELGTGWAQ